MDNTMKIIEDFLAKKLNVENVDPNKNLRDLGLDSLDVVEILLDLEDEFGITFNNDEMKELKTVEDLYKKISEKLANK